MTNLQSSGVEQPGKGAFDLPTLTIPRQQLQGSSRTCVLAGGFALTGDTRTNAALPPLTTQFLPIKVTVGHQHLRTRAGTTTTQRHAQAFQGGSRQLALVGLRTINIYAQRQPLTIHNQHQACTATLSCLSDTRSPFFAGMKLPSRNACAHSIFSAASNWPSSERQMRSHVPSADQRSNQRQQVVAEPYSFGKSAHAQPVFSTYNIPLIVRRSCLRLRPTLGWAGNSGWISSHWASLKLWRLIFLSPLLSFILWAILPILKYARDSSVFDR